MKKTLLMYTAAGVLSTLLSLSPAMGQGAAASQAAGQTESPAIKGYDVVAYFVDSKPEPGKPEFAVQRDGKTYLFSSEAHKALFEKDPEAYLPQYGGYCAFGASKGHKAPVDPESWAIVDGKLYLNSSPGAQKLFDKDRAGSIKQADENWKTLNADGSRK